MINWQNGVTPINETNMNKLAQNETFAYQTGTITLTSGYFDTVDLNQTVRTGNLAMITFRGQANTNIPNDGILGTLPFYVKGNVVISISTAGRYNVGDYKFAYMVNGNNYIKCNAIEQGKWVEFTVMCMVAE